MNTATTETAKNDTLEFAKELAKAYAIPAATGEKLDKMYAYREDRDEDNDVECPACPVLNEAQELSSFLLSVCDDECRARAIDGNPWNGVDYQGLRARALFTLRQVDRYLAARKARFGVEEGQPVPRQVIEAEREMREMP